jgi:hypothetical protein
MFKIIYTLLLITALPVSAKVLWGAPAHAPVVPGPHGFVSSTNLHVIYDVYNNVSDHQGTVTAVVEFIGDSPVLATNGNTYVTSNGVYHLYNNRPIQVLDFAASSNHSAILPPRLDRYRGWTYSNVLVVAVDWMSQMRTGNTYYVQNDVTDTTMYAGWFVTSGLFTAESVQAAELATNLWPGAHMLIISSNCVDIQPDYWEYWYNSECESAMQRVTSVSLDDLPETNAGTNTAKFSQWIYDFIRPITNYIGLHPEIKMVAFSYGMPDHAKWEDGEGWNGTKSIISMFLGYSVTNFARDKDSHLCTTNLQAFSFSCRTFSDTTNLLIRSTNFNIIHQEGGVVLDVLGGYGAFDGFAWSLITNPLTNYLSDVRMLTYNYESKVLTVTSSYPLVMSWNWGWYSQSPPTANSPDNLRRSILYYQPLPNSMSGSIESYNACSLYTNPDASVKKHGQTRLYDCFAPTANFGIQSGADTNDVALYSRTYGCAFGHTMEPFLGGVYTAEDFYPYMCQGYSFVECFYTMGQAAPDGTVLHNGGFKIGHGHIVCGHPFLRITDFAVEGTEPWDVTGQWPLRYP